MTTITRIAGDRGAAAIEFALVLPVLILLVVGLIEFGRAYNVLISLSNAAREGARTMAIENDPAEARASAIQAAPGLDPALGAGQIAVNPTDCATGETAEVTITYALELVTGYFGASIPLTGTGAMRCGG